MAVWRALVSSVASIALVAAFMPAAALAEQPAEETAASVSVPVEGAEYASDELLVTLDNQLSADTASQQKKADAAEDEAAETLEEAGAEGTEVLAEASTETGSVLKVDIDTGSSDSDIVAAQEELAAQPGVAAVQPNYRYSLPESTSSEADGTGIDDSASDSSTFATSSVSTGTNDPKASTQYYLGGSSSHGSNFIEAWEQVKCNGAVTVAVLDTGCYYEHEDLAANVNTTYMYDACDGVKLGSSRNNPSGDVDTEASHGTMTCGMISAVADNGAGMAGASYNATLLPVRVFEEDYTGELGCDTSTLLKAYDYLFELVDEGKVTNLHVVNMSLGGYGSLTYNDRLFSKAMETARTSYDIVSVCAGGNGDGDKAYTSYSFPGDDDAAVSVTALTTSGTNATWSDYNKYKDISAPGEKIATTSFKATTTRQPGFGGMFGGWFGGGSGGSTTTTYTATYSTEDGTSAASPIVASAFALLWAANPALSVDDACEAIYSTATKVTGSPDRSSTSGSHGALDAAAAVKHVLAQGGSISSCDVAAIADQAFTQAAVTPAVQVSDNGTVLTEGVDYTVAYTSNVNVGTAKATIKGKGTYSGTRTVTFQIVADTCAVLYANGELVIGFDEQPESGRSVLATFEDVDSAASAPWAEYAAQITKVRIAKSKNSKVTTMAAAPVSMKAWFSGCSKLTSVSLSGLDTSKVTSVNSLFKGCTALKSLACFSGLDLGSASNWSYAFSGCTALKTLDLTGATWVMGTTRCTGTLESCNALCKIIIDENFECNVVCGSHAALEYPTTLELPAVKWRFSDGNGLLDPNDAQNNSGAVTGPDVIVRVQQSKGDGTYTITNAEKRTVTLKNWKGADKTASIPAKVKLSGISYKVTKLAAQSFKGSKATTVELGMKSFTKSSIKNCFKGSKVKKVKLANKALAKKYKSLFRAYSGKSNLKVTA